MNVRRKRSMSDLAGLAGAWPWLMLALALCSAGCTTLGEYVRNHFKVGPNYEMPTAAVSPGWIDQNDPRVHSEPPIDLAQWWHVFHDPALDSLIDTAREQNLDLKTTGTRVLQSLAQRNIQVGNLFPQSQSALGTYVHGQLSNNLNIPFPTILNAWATGFNASWEIDFWGRYRRSVESANATFDASVEDYHNALVTLFADVATYYVQLRTYQQRLVFARKNVALQKNVLELTELRFKKGVITEVDVQQARANLAQTEALIPTLKIGMRQASNQLCVLLGMPPESLGEALGDGTLPATPSEVTAGIPIELLRRRPDIRRAERQVAAQSAQIGVAEAQLYPRFTLFGFLGYVSSDIRSLFDEHSFTGFIAPTVQWNILNYGRLLNNIRNQQAAWQGTVFQYQQTVLTAQREAENAMVAFLESQEQVKSLARSVAAYERTVQLVIDQYRNGTTDFNRVYTTQSALVTQQDQLVAAQGSVALNLIALYRSLGGGWEVEECLMRATQLGPPHNLPTTVEELRNR